MNHYGDKYTPYMVEAMTMALIAMRLQVSKLDSELKRVKKLILEAVEIVERI